MSELGKPFLKNQIKKYKKKQKIGGKMPHVNKNPLARNESLFQTKKIRPWENHLEKTRSKKSKKQ